MLQNSFIHIPGIGSSTEEKLWDRGVCNWADLDNRSDLGLSPSKSLKIRKFIEESALQLKKKNPNFFESLLPANQLFRFFPDFRDSLVYLDIETTGLSMPGKITTIAMYDGKTIKYYVQGENLTQFLEDIKAYDVIVTYNGKTFDVPFIQEYFNTTLTHSHIDLRYILASLGFKGGLKKCEKALGIDRQELEGVDGYFAVLLWDDFIINKNPKALDTLLAYNIEDVVNLETLLVKSYNLKLKGTPFYRPHQIDIPASPEIPFSPDAETIRKIKGIFY